MTEYLTQRQNDSLLCLYTFDSLEINSVVDGCPFGTLIPNSSHVLSLGDDLVGYRLLSTPSPQISHLVSNDIAISRTFYESALNRHGITFEMIFSLVKEVPNTNINLFSIASPYDDCTNPGFRVEVSDRQLLVLIFYVLKPDNKIQVCFELHFYSMMEVYGSTPCFIPHRKTWDENSPMIHAVISIYPNDPIPGEWSTYFQVTFHDDNGQLHECYAYNSMGGPTGLVNFDLVRGNFKLFIGNNGRLDELQTRVPRKPQRIKPIPVPAPTKSMHLTLLEDVGNFLTLYIPQPGGFFLSFNGNKAIDFDENGISFGKNRKYSFLNIRNMVKDAFSKLKTSVLSTSLALRQESILSSLSPNGFRLSKSPKTTQPNVDWEKRPLHARYPAPNGSASFDVYLFAICKAALPIRRLQEIPAIELPHIGLPYRTRTINMYQDTSKQISLRSWTHNQRVGKPVRILTMPEFGMLTRCPPHNENISTATQLEDLCVIYTPGPNQSNVNVPKVNPYLVKLRASRPFVSFSYAQMNSNSSAVVDVFVHPIVKKSSEQVTSNPIQLFIKPPLKFIAPPIRSVKVHLGVALHSRRKLQDLILLRVTLKCGLEGAMEFPSDPLKKTSRTDYCSQQLKLGEVCLARDSNSSGVVYELHGMGLSRSQVVFQGTLRQVKHALANMTISSVAQYAHTTTLKIKVEAIDSKAVVPLRTKFFIDFTYDARTSMVCTPLFQIMPFICEETLGGPGGVWSAVFFVLFVQFVTHQCLARRSANFQLKQQHVQNDFERNAMLHCFKLLLQDENMDLPKALLVVCDHRHEKTIAIAAISIVLAEYQTMPCLFAGIMNFPKEEKDFFFCFYYRFIGRTWINMVIAETIKQPSVNESTLIETINRHINVLPIEIVLLSSLFQDSQTIGFIDHFILPSLDDCTDPTIAIMGKSIRNELKQFNPMIQQRAATEGYIPTKSFGGNLEILLPTALEHLIYLSKLYMERIAAYCEDANATHISQRLEQIILALHVSKSKCKKFVQLTQSLPSL